MKRLLTLILVFVLTAPAALGQEPEKGRQGTFALTNARLVTVTGGTIDGGTLVIRNDKIVALGTDVDVPAGAEVIDLGGLSVYPGMIDAGTQLGLAEVGSLPETRDFNEIGDLVPQMKALTAVNPNSVAIPVTRTSGVTTVITEPSGGLLPGQAALIHLHGYTPEQMHAGVELVKLQFPTTGRRGWWDRRSDEEIEKAAEKALKKLNDTWVHGFRVAHATFALMKRMATAEELASLKPERVWKEMKRALAEPQPWRFFETLQRCGALASLQPELARQMDAGSAHGAQVDSAPMAALKRAVAADACPEVCFAVVLAEVPGEVDELCRRLRAERPYSELLADVRDVLPLFERLPAVSADELLTLLQRYKAQQRPERFACLLVACAVLRPQGAEQRLSLLHAAVLALAEVRPESLQRQGLSGAELGEALRRTRQAALERLLQAQARGC